MKHLIRWLAGVVCITFGSLAQAVVVFGDDFNSAASPSWTSEFGNWVATGGVYDAGTPSTSPNARSALPFQLTDFTIDVDIINVSDGGVWLRSAPSASGIGRTGVLLVTGGRTRSGTGLYWHIITGGSYGSILHERSGLFINGASDPHLRIDVQGDTYAVFVNGSATAATSLTTNQFAAGQVALYDFSVQSFDNFQISSPVPEAASPWLLVLGLGFVGLAARCLPMCRSAKR